MAKKNKDINNPFSVLKGFSVAPSEQRVDRVKKSAARRPEVPMKERTPEKSDDTLFLEEMISMGLAEKPKRSCRVEESKVSTGVSDEDAALFLDAIDEMGPTFSDSLPEEAADKSATARLEKLLRQKKIVPEETLDLHGEHADVARRHTLAFLQQARARNVQSVLIVTGKGYGSKEGPVLKPAIEKLLRTDAARHVGQWCQAPQHLGGSGAIVALLRKQTADQ